MSRTSVAYGALLRLLPRGFRDRYASEMQQMFADEWRDSTSSRRRRLLLRAFRDVMWTAVVVRISPNYQLRPRPRAAGGGGMVSGVLADARVALRGLRFRPGFAATAA